jgi:hydroxymethylbilane synthase
VSQHLHLLVGTRDSILARRQTDLALKKILSTCPGCSFEIVAVKTSADKQLNKPLSELGGRGVFVKELEESLLAGSVDFVVHSLKDLPVDLPENLCLAATIERMDPRDVLVAKDGLRLRELQAGSRVATSSRRRAAQLAALRQDLQFVEIRGNIQTRLRKLDEGQCDAMVIAAAGLLRLGLTERICQYFEPSECTPAVGQGALGIECRQDNPPVLQIMQAINDADVWSCTAAEREFLHKLSGGCSVPAGALARLTPEGIIELTACIASLDGRSVFRDSICGARESAAQLGSMMADRLIGQGASEVIDILLSSPSTPVSPP